MSAEKNNISFQSILNKLFDFWNNFGCVPIPPAQTEISSVLFHPTTFFQMISNKDFDVMFFQPHVASMDIKDVKYTKQNYTFSKFQVILKSQLELPQKTIIDSLKYIGLSTKNNEIRFNTDTFENFIFRIKACGDKLSFNNITIAKIYYIQNIGYSNLDSIPLVITYDLDKILALLQGCKNIWDASWNGENNEDRISYKDIMYDLENDNYTFVNDISSNEILFKQFELSKELASKLLENNIIIPAFISILKAKYYLDILTLRNFITFNNKITYNKLLRDLVDLCCKKYLKTKNSN